jgi:phosphotransacetylase
MALSILVTAMFALQNARAHCDTFDGPVIEAAQRALDEGNLNYVLIWVQKENEPEIKRVFDQTMTVRKLNPAANALADRYFFETLVRVHRAGEGATFTGLKPTGDDLGPAIPAADKALRDGKSAELIQLLRSAIDENVQRHFEAALKKRDFDKNDVEAGRRFVKAYVEYVHCVEALYQQATQPAHGHYAETGGHEHER